MHQYTKDNHYRFGWSGRWFNNPGEDDTSFQFQIGPMGQAPLDWKSECIRAAAWIGEQAGDLPITLAFSGGIDSEVAALSLLAAEVPFTPVITRYRHGLNEYDFQRAMTFVRAHDLTPMVLDLDLLGFLDARLWGYADLLKMVSPQIPVQLWMVEQMAGSYMVFCGGDQRVTRGEGGASSYITVKPQTSTVHRYMLHTGQIGCPYFFLATPELAYSFLDDPLTVHFVKHSYSMKMLSIKWFKPFIYDWHWREIAPKQKQTGFELIEPIDLKLRRQMEAKYLKNNPDIKIDYEDFKGYLRNGMEPLRTA